MHILFDQGTPLPLRDSLIGHEVSSAYERGWSSLENGDLLNAAETAGSDAIVTTDQNLRYQQNLKHRKLAILVLRTTSWPRIKARTESIIAAVSKLKPND